MVISLTGRKVTGEQGRVVEEFLSDFLPRLKAEQPGVVAVYHFTDADAGEEVTAIVWEDESARTAYRQSETFRTSVDAYDGHVGRYGAQLAAALIQFAGVRPGMRVRDVCCGPGALAAELACRLGTADVAAVDPSEPFVEACRRRLPEVEIVVAGAEPLPFADGAFDAALPQLVVNLMRDPEADVREMTRVTRPGGIVASCVSDYVGEMTLLCVLGRRPRNRPRRRRRGGRGCRDALVRRRRTHTVVE